MKVEKEEEDIVSYSKGSDGVWEVSSKRLYYWVNRIPLNTSDNFVRFIKKANIEEIENILKDKGAKVGDIFRIKDQEFEIN